MPRIRKDDHPRILQMIDVEHRKVSDVATAFGCSSAAIYALVGRLRRDAASTVVPAPVQAPLALEETLVTSGREGTDAPSGEPAADAAARRGRTPVRSGTKALQADLAVEIPSLELEAESGTASVVSCPRNSPPQATDAGDRHVAAGNELASRSQPPGKAEEFGTQALAAPTDRPAPAGPVPADAGQSATDVAMPVSDVPMPVSDVPKPGKPDPKVANPAAGSDPVGFEAGSPKPTAVPNVVAFGTSVAAPPARSGRGGSDRRSTGGVGAKLAKPGYGLVMRTAEGEESLTPFRSLDELLSAVKPILRAAATSAEPVWFSLQPVDLASIDMDAA